MHMYYTKFDGESGTRPDAEETPFAETLVTGLVIFIDTPILRELGSQYNDGRMMKFTREHATGEIIITANDGSGERLWSLDEVLALALSEILV